MEEKIAPHVDEIIRALDTAETKIDKSVIHKELAKLLEFKVPIAEAKRSLLKKYGLDDISEVKTLADLCGGERNIEITARILDINSKIVGIKGQERTIFMGIMADESGARTFTAWDDFGLTKGDVVKISNAYTRIWQGMPEINFGPRSKVEKLYPNILNPLMFKDLEKPVMLEELKDGAPAVHTKFRILESEQQEITTRNGPRTIISGIAVDSSAKLPFTSWISSPELVEGNTVDVENTYVKSWRGVPCINISEFTVIHNADPPITDDEIAGILNPSPIRLDDITGRDGALDVIVEGSIISVRSGSGLITRCPKCSRVIQNNICRIHGTIDGKDDLRIKSILDDGTGALTIVLDANLTQKVTGYSIEKSKEVASAAMNQAAVEDEIRRKLLGKTMRLRGNMTKGEYGITLVATDAQITEIDTAAAAASLIEEMEPECLYS
jgi:replication factor A1